VWLRDQSKPVLFDLNQMMPKKASHGGIMVALWSRCGRDFACFFDDLARSCITPSKKKTHEWV
jgi:hypothetical protein